MASHPPIVTAPFGAAVILINLWGFLTNQKKRERQIVIDALRDDARTALQPKDLPHWSHEYGYIDAAARGAFGPAENVLKNFIEYLPSYSSKFISEACVVAHDLNLLDGDLLSESYIEISKEAARDYFEAVFPEPGSYAAAEERYRSILRYALTNSEDQPLILHALQQRDISTTDGLIRVVPALRISVHSRLLEGAL